MTSSTGWQRAPDEPVMGVVRDPRSGTVLHTDLALARSTGIVVAFTERTGGVSDPPYDSLNLAAHVGDDPRAVDINRERVLASLGLEALRCSLVTAEQVHGEQIEVVGRSRAGAGAYADLTVPGSVPPIAGTDALITSERDIPLMMCFADCVPVILAAPMPVPAVAVVHAGWRGALASLPGMAARALADRSGCEPVDLFAYIGPHIARCCYNVDERLLSHFAHIFDTIGAVDGHLDLAATVREALTRTGVSPTRIVSVDVCTRDATDRFYSYRADPVTGRHGALAVIAEGD